MMSKLELVNFRGFRRHTVEFPEFAVIAGRNNAGKSTLIEAIRILSDVMPRFLQGSFSKARTWVGTDTTGVHLRLEHLGLRAATLFHRYDSPPAVLNATFAGGAEIRVMIGVGGEAFVEGTLPSGMTVDSRTNARKAGYPHFAVLPQISPLMEEETVLKAAYVQSCSNTQRSSRQFRNQIRFNHQHFDTFAEMFHQTWESVRISSFDSADAEHGEPLSLLLSEDGFVAEASDFGHGLQMWLQIVWFLARTPDYHIVVLDEPDVYVHPEQQIRLLSLLRGRFRQCLISTHSPSILGNVSLQETLRIHRATKSSRSGVTESEHEEFVRTAVAEARHVAMEKIVETVELESDDDDDDDFRTVDVKVIVYDDARFVMRDMSGNVLIDITGQGSVHGRKVEEVVNVERVLIKATNPDSIVVYINKRRLAPVEFSDTTHPAVELQLGGFAE